MNVFIIILLLNIVNGYLISPKNKIQYFYGNYILRTTDDLSLKSKYTFLVLSENNKIKLKTINLKGIFSSKVSRSGTIVFAKNHKLFINCDLIYKWLNCRINEISFLPFIYMSFKIKKDNDNVLIQTDKCPIDLSLLVDKKIKESLDLLF